MNFVFALEKKKEKKYAIKHSFFLKGKFAMVKAKYWKNCCIKEKKTILSEKRTFFL
jgi:hypothetical protein